MERWFSIWRGLGVTASPDLERLYARLVAAYTESHRHYHTLRHVRECFARLDELRVPGTHPHEVELALWFHDAIYKPRRSDNEARSADWARTAALEFGVNGGASARIHALVLATRHAAAPDTPDAQVLVDVDLSILGAERGRFDEYEQQVRREYRWVPGFLYRRERARILREFLARPRIYSTPAFFERFEAAARANLERSLAGAGS